MLKIARQEGSGPAACGQFDALPFRQGFDVVVCPMRTIGHVLTPTARSRLLRQVRAVLRPGGKLVFDHYNIDLDWAKAHDGRPLLMYAGRDDENDGLALLIWDTYDYRFSDQRMRCTVTVERIAIGGEVVSREATSFDFGWLRHEQVLEEAHQTGFVVEDCFGGFDRSPFTPESDQMIWVLRRPYA